VAEALHLRDHVIRKVELTAASDDPDERAARCTFVVVGAGYTETEVAALGPALGPLSHVRSCGGTASPLERGNVIFRDTGSFTTRR
jgi:hypothetical protein